MFSCLTAVAEDPLGAAGAASVFLRLRVVLGLSAVVFVAILLLGGSLCVGSRALGVRKREKGKDHPT